MKLLLPLIILAVCANDACAGTLTVGASRSAGTPDILGYNLGHFFPGSNAHDWWRYSGVNGARIFISVSAIEPVDDLPPRGDGVSTQATFISRKAALRADPLNPAYIAWPAFEAQYANEDLGSPSGNHIKVNDALGKLRQLETEIVAQITASENTLPIADANDWAGKWELWQHYYAQAFYLAKNFAVRRYQMFNEPNHSNANGLTAANWLMRLQLASDAIQSAIADVNARYGKVLTPTILAPVTAGSAGAYNGWGSVAVENRHKNFLGVSDSGYFSFQRYDYHQYNSAPANFGADLNSLKSLIQADMPGESRFTMCISEFNVHSGAIFDTYSETLDSPAKYTRFGSIAINLVRNLENELYCFKFGQTKGQAGYTYPVAKNGMHYVDNNNAPFNYGGITKTGEVWRLFNKASATGRDQLGFSSGTGLEDLALLVTHDLVTGRYFVFSANESANSVPLTIDCSAWNIPDHNRITIEEASETNSGSVAYYTQVSGGQISTRTQPPASVWLYTIPAKAQQEVTPTIPTQVIEASDDATVQDGSNRDSKEGARTTLLARNDPADPAQRSAALIKFNLPVIYRPDIQLAVLNVQASTAGATSPVQAHVYALDDDGWSQDSVTWSNAPNLKQNAVAGNEIRYNVVAGGGDTAHIQGQLLVDSTTPVERQIDVTQWLRGQPDRAVTFLVVQDARWDIALPSLASGDTQPSGLQIVSMEGAASGTPGPRLKLVRLKDSDGDGIGDEAEVNVFGTLPNKPDTDGDGLSDGVEVLTYGSNPKLADSDGDQVSDGDEAIAGTNLTDPASYLRITSVIRAGSAVQLFWPSVAGKTYTVERASTLSSRTWQTVGSTSGTGGVVSFTDQAAPAGAAYYRLRVGT